MIRVRRARKTDAEAIAALARELGRWIMGEDGTTSGADVRRYAFGPQRWCDILVAHDGPTVVGYALTRHFFEGFTGRRRMFLSDLAVAADTRRAGVGERLMARVCRHAQSLDCDVVTWECSDNNHVALAFYDKLDAERIDRVVFLSIERERINEIALSA